MSLNHSNITYNTRALSAFQDILFRIRAWFYEKEIIVSIFQAMWSQKSDGKNIDLWGGMWHKTQKIVHNLISDKWLLELIEPSDGMRKKAQKKLKNENILISAWSSRDLSQYEWVENIFCNQVTHHLNTDEKQELFENTYTALGKDGKLFILDTTVPESKFLKAIFGMLRKSYKKIIWKDNNYYNITTQQYIDMLEEAGFEIELEHTRHFYILKKLGEIGTKLWILYPFMTQIVAVKK